MWTSDGKPNKDPAYRSSQTAKLEQSNKFVKEISNRAQSFPFYKSMGEVEPLVVQKYAVGNQYKDHYDWYFPRPGMRGNRESTFFVYIEGEFTFYSKSLYHFIFKSPNISHHIHPLSPFILWPTPTHNLTHSQQQTALEAELTFPAWNHQQAQQRKQNGVSISIATVQSKMALHSNRY